MINKQLIDPESIVVVGASNDVGKPGGKILKNILDGNFKGRLYVVNPKETMVQGIKSYQDIRDIPDADLAVIAIAAPLIPDTVDILTTHKNTKAFIIISAGFSEESEEGRKLEQRIVAAVNAVGGALIGPNCIGILTPNHQSIFTEPIPKLAVRGCSLVSGSGATACFIMEAGIQKGLTFSSVISVGNSAQMGVEEIVKFMDETYDPQTSADIKLLYIENLGKPAMLLKHATSLIQKGCKIAAIKAGSSEAGMRAASSHTGALASPDMAVDALFRKAGIVRCYGREELIAVASVFMNKDLIGPNIAVISHAGGPAVMLTDTLAENGMAIPRLEGPASAELKKHLFPGSSVANPIDFLATGTAEQLGTIIDFAENKFDDIHGMAVIFGTPGLKKIFDVYEVLDKKMDTCRKPVYPILPSVTTANEEIKAFLSRGRSFFSDEVTLGKAIAKVYHTPRPSFGHTDLPAIDKTAVRTIIDSSPDGYLTPELAGNLLDAAGILRVAECVVATREEAIAAAQHTGYPLVMKVVGPVHKTDVKGVSLNIINEEELLSEYDRMIRIKGTTALLIQPMLSGVELFAGAKYEDKFGHIILCGLGGVFIEVMKDISAMMAPVSSKETLTMIHALKGYDMIKGIRGMAGVNDEAFASILCRLSALLDAAPEIMEMDINPLICKNNQITAADVRIFIKKSSFNCETCF
ncbi:MAG: acetate--CoA ligase family protein [Bacteroidetes bacterium]|nr:acetate--CoA ligase family protein [Bacteroidota bacterium]